MCPSPDLAPGDRASRWASVTQSRTISWVPRQLHSPGECKLGLGTPPHCCSTELAADIGNGGKHIPQLGGGGKDRAGPYSLSKALLWEAAHTEVLDCGVSARTQAGITQVAVVVWEWGAYRLETLGHTRLVPGLHVTWKQVLSASSIQEVGSPI